MNKVTFDPWVGEKYGKGPVLKGKKVLVVGTSHYCGCYDVRYGCGPNCRSRDKDKGYGKYSVTSINGERFFFGKQCEAFTTVVVRRYLKWAKLDDKKANGYFGTFTKFCNAFFAKGRADGLDRAALLNELAHMEYVQGAEGRDPKAKDKTLFDSERNYRELCSVILEHRPDIVICWGNRLWVKLVEKFTPTAFCDDVVKANVGSHEFFIVRSYHPSSSAFDRDRLRKGLAKAGLKL